MTEKSKLQDLVLDSTRALLYYTDSGLGVVGQVSTDGRSKTTIIIDVSSKPTAVAIDTLHRFDETYLKDIVTNQPVLSVWEF